MAAAIPEWRGVARRGLADHLSPSGPKRILALDGGGVRGILTLQYLAAIEDILRTRRADPDFVLADYFDLIGGTSTGAIIAAGLALGYPVAKIDCLYRDLAARIFRKPFFRLGAIVPKFRAGALISALQQTYGAATTLGSPALKTGLLVMTKRMDTGSPWPLTNHPCDPYYSPQAGKQRIGNANMLLWQVVRASTAAPHYFRPEDLEVGRVTDPLTGRTIAVRGQFVDGGVTTANNPSLELLKVALLDGFGFRWNAGADNLLLVSVGTGLSSRAFGRPPWYKAAAAVFAMSALASLMGDCNDEVETLLQWLSDSQTARRIDGQIRDLKGQHLAGAPLLSYLRYNVIFDQKWMSANLGTAVEQRELDGLAQMDRPTNMYRLAEIGAAAARAGVQAAHLPAHFDPP